MHRNLVKVTTAFALIMSASVVYSGTADAGLFGKLFKKDCCAPSHGGGLFSNLGSRSCGGGLFSRLHSHNDCCAPEPVCCEPEPVCCEPEPVCCEPEPVCCEPAPACGPPEPTCCGGSMVAEPAVGAGCSDCGGSVVESAPMSSAGYDLAPGEMLVPGSVSTQEAAPEAPEAAEASEEESSEGDAVPSSSDEEAPPAPTPDANTDI